MSAKRRYDLIAFDVDGTLIGHADDKVIWNVINHRFCADHATDGLRFRAYLDGEITYEEWVDLDIGGWATAGVTREQLVQAITDELYPMPGARETLARLRELGYRLAVISGTIDITLDVLLPRQRFEAVFTNRIGFDERGRIASWRATRYDMAGKAVALQQVASDLGVDLERTVFVGDNINDVEAMRTAGLAVAYHPKHDSVAEAADAVIHGDLRRLIELLE